MYSWRRIYKKIPAVMAIASLAICPLVFALGLVEISYAESDLIDYTEFPLEDLMELNLVYGASKYMQKTKEAPSSISIVTREDILTFGYRTLAEVLSSQRGFHLTYDRSYHYIGVRGLGDPGDMSSRLLVLVDGLRVNEGSIGGVLMGPGFPVDMDIVERIEIIRGPASSIYGTNAMLGIVNVVTREGYQVGGIQASVGVSSFAGRRARFTVGHETVSGIDLLISGTIAEVNGQDHYIEEFDYPYWNNGVFQDGDEEKWHSFTGKMLYQGLTLETFYSWRSKRNPMASGGVIFNNNQAMSQDSQLAFNAIYRKRFGALDLAANVNYQRFKYDSQWPYDFDYDYNYLDHVDIYEDLFRGKRLTLGLDLSRKVLANHTIAIGAEYQNNFQMDMIARDVDPYYLWHDFRQSPENWGAYILSEIRLYEGLLLNIGVRHDEYKTFGGSTNPRLALVTEPMHGSIFKALYGTAFRAPNGYEVGNQADIEDSRADISLIPEEITTYELIWEQALGRDYYATASVYHYDYLHIQDGIEVDNNLPPEEWVNDAVESRGVEVELEKQHRSGIRGRCSFSYNEPRDRLDNPLYGDPKQAERMLKFNLTIPVYNSGTRIGVELQSNSKRKTILREYAPGHVLTNLSIFSSSLIDGFEIRGSVYNLFNKSHGQPGTWGEYQEIIWQDGRSFRLGLTYSR